MALAAEPWLPSRHGLCGAALHVVFFVLLVGVALLVGGMDRGGDLPAAEPATHPPWTDEEIAERRAEAWGNVTWSSPWSTWPGWEENAPPSANVHLQAAPTESTPSSGVTLPPPSSSSSAPSTGMTFPSLSSSPQEVPLQAGSAMSLSPVHHDLQDSTWDENISLGLQEEEVHLAGGWGDRGPLAPIPEDVPPPFGLPGPAASSDAKPMDLINQEADNVSLDKLLDVRPLRGRRPLRADGLSPLPLGRDPSSLATPKNSGQLRPGEIDWSSPGITRRGSSVRPGIDRWHHLDGTIRYRLREQQGNASGGQASGSAPQTCAKDDESGTGGASSSASSWTSTSFYPAKQVQSGREEKEALQETSTCDTGRGDISSTAVSSNSSCTEVGFWRHGEWHARERTPQEARLHRGGNGPQRSHRKQQRMNSYFQGEWRPAWLEKYIEDRNKRSQAAEIQEPARPQSASDLADTAPTSSTDVDPWSGQWTGRDDSWWGSSTWGVTSWFSWNASWSWTSSTTTAEPTMEVPQELPPNHGLFPDVGPALPPAPPNPWLLQLTGAERRLLQEGGVPELPLERIDLLLECLEDHQAAEHGAEARWALARLARRLEDALDSLQLVLEILVRRLQPRGYLPVVRTPATRAEQVRLLDWMRRSTSFLAETLEYHLQSPLESSEVNLGTPRVPWASSPESHGPGVGQHGHASDNASGGTGAASSSSSSPALRTAGSEEPVRSRSRSPVPVPSAMEMGVDAYGYDICLMPSASNQECGPQHDTNAWLQHSPMMQRVLEGELMGIWSEPDAEIDTSSTTTAPMDIDDFTTMVQLTMSASSSSSTWSSSNTGGTSSSSTWMSPSMWVNPCTHSPGTLTTAWTTTSTPSNTSCTCSTTAVVTTSSLTWMWSSSTSTSSSTTTTTPSTSSSRTTLEAVGDATAGVMVFANTADVIDTLHRLLARSRALVRHQRLLLESLEEVAHWLPAPPTAPVLNGPSLDAAIWQNVARNVPHADGMHPGQVDGGNGTLPSPAPLAVLLQPGLPEDLQTLDRALPSVPTAQVAGLRRRLWRHHVGRLHVQSGRELPQAENTSTPLFLVQTNEEEMVPQHSGDAPHLAVPNGRVVHSRRRLHPPRRVSLFEGQADFSEAALHTGLSLATNGGLPSSAMSSSPLPPPGAGVTTTTSLEGSTLATPELGLWETRPSARERSRSRDRGV